MKTEITGEKLRKVLLDRCRWFGSVAAWARNNGVAVSYVNEVVNGKKAPGEKLLARIGARRVVRYAIDLEESDRGDPAGPRVTGEESDGARIERLEAERGKLAEALTLMLCSCGVDSEDGASDAAVFENGVRAIERLYGMPFLEYLEKVSA